MRTVKRVGHGLVIAAQLAIGAVVLWVLALLMMSLFP